MNNFNLNLVKQGQASKMNPFSQLFVLLLCVVSLLVCSSHSVAQVTQLSASVDRNTILVDESINLTLAATGSVDRDAIEFSALEQHFSVSRPSFSMSTQIINGNMTRNVSWTLSLHPKQTGRFEIPSFEIDGKRTQPFYVNVLALDENNSTVPRDFYISAEVNQSNIYLQQQLLYTLKIHLSRDIQRGNLNLPVLEGALVEQIGEDRDYQDIIDGVRYRIIERKYAIIPQSSGEFVIGGPIFEAEVLTNSRQNFANFGRTRSISRRAPDISISVSPIPDDYNYTWLPSEFVEVNEEWQGDINNLVVGEPITRTITVTALGLTKEQLPPVSTVYHPDFKVYPEQANLEMAETAQALVSQSTLNTAIIPSKSGNYVIPEVRVPWFNVKTGQTEFALIPAKSVSVQAKPNDNVPLTQQAIPETSTEQKPDSKILTETDSSNQTATWLIYGLILSNAITLITLLIVWFSRKPTMIESPSTAQQINKQTYSSSEAVLFNQLTASIEQKQVAKLSLQLDAWLSVLLGTQHHSVSLSLLKYGGLNGASGENSLLDFYNQVLAQQTQGSTNEIDFESSLAALKKMRLALLEEQGNPILKRLYPQ